MTMGGRRVAVQHRWVGRTGAVAATAGALLAVAQAPASAATDPYAATPYGYDVSYPQCPGTSAPTPPTGKTFSFAIVGVGGGRPFTASSCAAAEAAAAAKAAITNIAQYFNTGYAGAYARNILATCSADVANGTDDGVFAGITGHTLKADEQAWEIGCSEALYAQDLAVTPGPTMWWADVETGNSWSTSATLNDFTLDGLSYQMQQGGALGGIYSYTSAWNAIAGAGFTPRPPENANWVAFAGDTLNAVPTWVTQAGTSGGVDQDLGS